MEIELRNDTFSFKVDFRDCCVIIESTAIMDKVPEDANKHAILVSLRPDGRWDVKMEMFIPTGIIYDALNIQDEQFLRDLRAWVSNMKEDIWISRNSRKKK